MLPDEEDSGTQSSGDWDDVFCIVFLFFWGVSGLNVFLVDGSGLDGLQKFKEEVSLSDGWVLEGLDLELLGDSEVSPLEDFVIGEISKSLIY